MRRAFDKQDFPESREAIPGDNLVFGKGAVNANMGGECDVVYGAELPSALEKIPVIITDGTIVTMGGLTGVVRRATKYHEVVPGDDYHAGSNDQLIFVVPMIDMSFYAEGKTIKVDFTGEVAKKWLKSAGL